MNGLDRLILGSNPLVGVSHYSSRSAHDKLYQLTNEKVIATIDAALTSGATAINFSPTRRMYDVLKLMRDRGYNKEFNVYLMLPDMELFREAMLTGGTAAVAKQMLAGVGWVNRITLVAGSALSIMSRDPLRFLESYIDFELRKLEGILPQNAKIKSILVHEQLTDLAIALGAVDTLKEFARYAAKRCMMPGFITRNYPLAVQFSTEYGINLAEVVIMTPFNRIGFQMTPDRETCEAILSSRPESKTVGMSILAGGRVPLNEAVEYLKSIYTLKSIVVGVSSVTHAKETMSLFSTITDRQ